MLELFETIRDVTDVNVPVLIQLRGETCFSACFSKDENYWIVGEYDYKTEGITRYNLRNIEFQYIDFENEINLNPKSFYSVIKPLGIANRRFGYQKYFFSILRVFF